MNVIVVMKQLPDLVEELELNSDGTDIDRDYIKFVVNEWDEAALEEGLLIKEASGGTVTVVALDEPEVDQTLYTALAKGADKAVKITGIPEGWIDTHTRATILAGYLSGQSYDLILTGVQAADDLDGQLASLLGTKLGLPHSAVVARVEIKDGAALVRQEFSAGLAVEEEVQLPAVIGVQAARQAPRYAPITRIRQAMQAGGLEEASAADVGPGSGLTVRKLFPPEKTGHAEMIDGSPEEVAAKIIELIKAKGVVK